MFARERAEKYISLCNPPPQSGKKRISLDATARRGDGIATKFLRSLRNPLFPPLRAAVLTVRTGSAGSSRPLHPGYLLCATRPAGGLAFRGLGRVLQSPGSICLALSSTPFVREASWRRACLTRIAAEGFSFDINTWRYRGRVGVSMYTLACDRHRCRNKFPETTVYARKADDSWFAIHKSLSRSPV